MPVHFHTCALGAHKSLLADYALSWARGYVAETPVAVGPGQASLCDASTVTSDVRACVDDPGSMASVSSLLGELVTGLDCNGGGVVCHANHPGTDLSATRSYADTSMQYLLHLIWTAADALYAAPVTADGRIDCADRGDTSGREPTIAASENLDIELLDLEVIAYLVDDGFLNANCGANITYSSGDQTDGTARIDGVCRCFIGGFTSASEC